MRRTLALSSLVALAMPLAGAAAETAAPVRVIAKVSVGKKPCAAAFGYGAVWVTNYGAGTVRVVDPAGNRTVGRPIKVGSAPCGIATGGGAVWVNEYGTSRVVKINPRRRKAPRPRPTSGPPIRRAVWSPASARPPIPSWLESRSAAGP